MRSHSDYAVTWFRVFTQKLDWPYDIPTPEILSAEERERFLRIDLASVRTRYAQSHVFLRETLSRFAPVKPGDWEFGAGEFGRPFIKGPAAGLGLDFNLSHTRDYVACVVTDGAACGIDIERIHLPAYLMPVARRQFAAGECDELEKLDEGARLRRFFELWTEKEAWVKAHGQGLRMATNLRIGEIPGVRLHRLPAPANHAMAVVLL